VKRVAVLAIVLGAASVAAADPAADLAKQGIALYKAGKYADASATLQRSYELSSKPETLFALAQAERLAGDCKSATQHYQQLFDQVSDFNVAKMVEKSMAMCLKDEPPPPPTTAPAPVQAAPPPPQVITMVVTRDVAHHDVIAETSMGVGAVALGAAAGFYMAEVANRDAADAARTLDDHVAAQNRATTDERVMFAAAGAGVALMGFAVFRWVRGDESSPSVAVTASPLGHVWVTAHW
jgi:tetratricopeptide (TPR) repeat protein